MSSGAHVTTSLGVAKVDLDPCKIFPFLLDDFQLEAIDALNQGHSVVVSAPTGSGKTFTAVTTIYRLIKFAKAKRVLFLVDRANLGRQALREFQDYQTPDDGRKFIATAFVLDNVRKLYREEIEKFYPDI